MPDDLQAWRERCPIRQYRAEHGLSRSDLAALTSVSVNSISAWERDGSLPSQSSMTALRGLGNDLPTEFLAWLGTRPSVAA